MTERTEDDREDRTSKSDDVQHERVRQVFCDRRRDGYFRDSKDRIGVEGVSDRWTRAITRSRRSRRRSKRVIVAVSKRTESSRRRQTISSGCAIVRRRQEIQRLEEWDVEADEREEDRGGKGKCQAWRGFAEAHRVVAGVRRRRKKKKKPKARDFGPNLRDQDGSRKLFERSLVHTLTFRGFLGVELSFALL